MGLRVRRGRGGRAIGRRATAAPSQAAATTSADGHDARTRSPQLADLLLPRPPTELADGFGPEEALRRDSGHADRARPCRPDSPQGSRGSPVRLRVRTLRATGSSQRSRAIRRDLPATAAVGHRGTGRSRKDYDAAAQLCNATPRHVDKVCRNRLVDSVRTSGIEAGTSRSGGTSPASARLSIAALLVVVELDRPPGGASSSTVTTQSPQAMPRADAGVAVDEHRPLTSALGHRRSGIVADARSGRPTVLRAGLSRAGQQHGRRHRPRAGRRCRRRPAGRWSPPRRPAGRLGGDQAADEVVGDLVGRAEQHPHPARGAAAGPAAWRRRRTRR